MRTQGVGQPHIVLSLSVSRVCVVGTVSWSWLHPHTRCTHLNNQSPFSFSRSSAGMQITTWTLLQKICEYDEIPLWTRLNQDFFNQHTFWETFTAFEWEIKIQWLQFIWYSLILEHLCGLLALNESKRNVCTQLDRDRSLATWNLSSSMHLVFGAPWC